MKIIITNKIKYLITKEMKDVGGDGPGPGLFLENIKTNSVILISLLQALNLTCNISGDPVPEVTWLKNEREMVSDDHYVLKFESGKFASFTITTVNTSDSGKYSILVKNKYGTESGDFTVSVFIPDDMPVKKK